MADALPLRLPAMTPPLKRSVAIDIATPDGAARVKELARAGKYAEATRLYRWFLPLLRLDTVPKFVQLIKFVQEETGHGSARVRAPRLELTDAEKAEARQVLAAMTDIRIVLADRLGIEEDGDAEQAEDRTAWLIRQAERGERLDEGEERDLQLGLHHGFLGWMQETLVEALMRR